MGYEKEHEPPAPPNICVVHATDDQGRVIAREAFPSQDAADAHAAELRAKGYTVEQSRLDPPEDGAS